MACYTSTSTGHVLKGTWPVTISTANLSACAQRRVRVVQVCVLKGHTGTDGKWGPVENEHWGGMGACGVVCASVCVDLSGCGPVLGESTITPGNRHLTVLPGIRENSAPWPTLERGIYVKHRAVTCKMILHFKDLSMQKWQNAVKKK